MARGPIRVVIAEDHRMFGQALQLALEAAPDMTTVGLAATSGEAMTLVRSTQPDIVLMDYRLPDRDGIETAMHIRTELPSCRVIMLTASTGDRLPRRALASGCSAYITKDQSVDQVINTIRATANGETLISEALLTRLITGRGTRRIEYHLTPREAEILQLIAEGLSNAAIARRLGLRLTTVRNHVQRVLNKLYAHSKLEAVATAVRAGLIDYEVTASL